MILGVLVCFAVVGLGCTSSGSGLPAILAIVSPQPIPHFFKSQQIALPFLFFFCYFVFRRLLPSSLLLPHASQLIWPLLPTS